MFNYYFFFIKIDKFYFLFFKADILVLPATIYRPIQLSFPSSFFGNVFRAFRLLVCIHIYIYSFFFKGRGDSFQFLAVGLHTIADITVRYLDTQESTIRKKILIVDVPSVQYYILLQPKYFASKSNSICVCTGFFSFPIILYLLAFPKKHDSGSWLASYNSSNTED